MSYWDEIQANARQTATKAIARSNQGWDIEINDFSYSGTHQTCGQTITVDGREYWKQHNRSPVPHFNELMAAHRCAHAKAVNE